MSVVGLGLDVVDLGRIRELLERHGEAFLERIARPGEVRSGLAGRARVAHVGGLFAAKEAAMKALGTGWTGGVTFRQIEVRRSAAGAPELELHGAARERADALGVRRCRVSISHDGGAAAAVVLLEGDEP